MEWMTTPTRIHAQRCCVHPHVAVCKGSRGMQARGMLGAGVAGACTRERWRSCTCTSVGRVGVVGRVG